MVLKEVPDPPIARSQNRRANRLPRGFVRIRHPGLLAGRRRSQLLPLSRSLLTAALLLPTSPVALSSAGKDEASRLWTCRFVEAQW